MAEKKEKPNLIEAIKVLHSIEPGKGFLYLISDQSKSKKEEDKL